jgi:lipocalin-like protein
MNWLGLTFVVTAVGLTALPDFAIAQSLKDRLVGTWLLVSNTNTAPDGTKRQPFGENPKGVLILEANGRYAQVFTRPDRPKFKANNRLQGTRRTRSRRHGMARSRISAHGRSARPTRPCCCASTARSTPIRKATRTNVS